MDNRSMTLGAWIYLRAYCKARGHGCVCGGDSGLKKRLRDVRVAARKAPRLPRPGGSLRAKPPGLPRAGWDAARGEWS